MRNHVARSAAGSPTWRTWIGLIFVPLLVAGLLAWAFWSPLQRDGAATAAVVNNDQPVTVNGQIVPLGRELAGELAARDDGYTWVLTSADDARTGLADGSYAAAVTIPEDFSAKATSTAADQPMDAQRAVVRIETSRNAGLVDPVASNAVAGATLAALNRQVVQTYLENVYVGFSELHTTLGEAADGAGQLAEGAGRLAGGATALSDGSGALVVGLGQLSDGAGRVATGADELASGAGRLSSSVSQLSAGAAELAAGTERLVTGSAQLADGLDKAAADTAALPALTAQLAEGARQVAAGNRQMADTVAPLADRVIAAVDALPSGTAAAQQISELAARCAANGGQAGFCADLARAADRAAASAGAIDGERAKIRSAATEVKASVAALAGGAERVADGNAQLAANAKDLVGGLAGAAAGARELNTGVERVNTGAHQLASGADQLGSGAAALATGAGQLATGASGVADGAGQAAGGARELATGADRLADGATQVDGGAAELASGLTQGRNQVPSYSDAERTRLASVVAEPTAFDSGGLADFSRGAAAFILVLALWSSALATYLRVGAVPPDVRTARGATWRIVARAALPGAAVATGAAMLLGLLFAPLLGLNAGEWLALLGVLLLSALTFHAVHQAVVALLGRPGQIVSVAVLVLTLATGVISTVPAFLAGVLPFLPTHGALVAVRAVTAGADGAFGGVVELLGWLVAGLVVTLVATDRRRILSARELRLSAPWSTGSPRRFGESRIPSR
ncbi:YhgE/Pip family protein [Pseudonocardia hispaniensis]|uniref:YhgE/Pip family protein n=1 Tax=Pseudonocardia hispaniensis TaxID=904933 RepID=A0ABW1J563_9PSEU